MSELWANPPRQAWSLTRQRVPAGGGIGRWRLQPVVDEPGGQLVSALIGQMQGAPAPPAQQGWKDVVALDDDNGSSFVVRLDHPTTETHPFMCRRHVPEHEDRGTMGQFTVT